MKKIYLFVSLLFVLFALNPCVSAAVTYCSSSVFGYSTATGGGSATPVLVSSVDGLKKALNKANNKVIIITANLTFTNMLTVQDGSNVTLLGMPGVTLTNEQQTASTSGILFFKRFSNLIIRNLTFVGPGAYDCDGNDLLCFENVTNAWVDHCDFQDGVDGNFDNKHNTDNITVSWCRFRYLKAPKSGGSGGSDDHRYTNLLGSSASDKPSDGTYNLTWAYCWWDNGCKERMVRCRNAELHFLNCYWNSSVANYYVGPENAKCYFEGCTFDGKANTKDKIFKSYGGTNACKFEDCSGNLPSNSGTVSKPSYTYTASGREEAKDAIISSCGAGATLTVTKAGEVSSTCDGGAALPTIYTVTWDASTNGGACITASSVYESGDEIGTLPVATKSGYTFDGWFTSASGGTAISASTTVLADITYFAQFTEESGGGGGTGDCIEWAGSPNSLSGGEMTVSTNLKLSVSDATIGSQAVWSGSGNKTVFQLNGKNYYVQGHLVDNSDIGDITVSAANNQDAGNNYNYAILYCSNADFTTGVTYDTHAAPSNKDSQDDSKLIHKFTAPSGTKYFRLYRKAENVGGVTVGDNKTTYVYKVEVCSVGGSTPPPAPNFVLSYDENGGTGTMEDQEQTGANVTVAANGFTAPTGYKFYEWNDNRNGNGTDYDAGDGITLTADLTLYAIWEPLSYTITFDKASGSGGADNVSATFDEPMPSIAIPSRTGYTFLGYFTGEDGTGTQYYDGNGNSTNSWTTASGATLHAAWESGGVTPSLDCALHYWFFKEADAKANGITNDETVFASMVSSGSSLNGSITVDGISSSVTGRTGDPGSGIFGYFTIPDGKTGIFYGLAVSSGDGDRQINLESSSYTSELSVPGGSKSYQRLESEVLPAGTYAITRDGTSNVRMGVVIVKICEAPPTAKKVYLKPGTNWMKQGSGVDPRFAVYYWKSTDDSDHNWLDMTLEDDCGPAYSVEIPNEYDKCIFCRMAGDKPANDWSNKWNQTSNLDVPTGNAIFFTVPDGAGDYSGSWSETPLQCCVDGTWLRFAGETIMLTAKCVGARKFQWYKDGVAIPEATSATYTKAAAIGDGGNYTCKAWLVVGQEATSSPHGVRVPFIEIQTPPAPTDPHNGDYVAMPLIRASEEAETASCSLYRGVAWDYAYSVTDGLGYHGNKGTMTSANCTNWTMDSPNWCRMQTTKEGTYTFEVKFSNSAFTNYTVSLVYPPMKQTAGRPIYIENTASMGWNPDAIYYRIGKGQYGNGDDRNWTAAQRMTLVPGTARYFQTTTPDWGNDFWAWHICNNRGDINQLESDVLGGDEYSIYRTKVVPGNEANEITQSSNFSGDEIPDGGWTIYLADEGENGKIGDYNNNCEFHDYTHTPGMLTHKVTITAPEHGTLTVNYVDVENNPQAFGSGDRDLAHTCIITVTAVPECGYAEPTEIFINGSAYGNRDPFTLTEDIIVSASFDVATYSITYNLDGGTINSGEVTEYTFGVGATLPTDVTKSGKEFEGWYDNPGCSGSPVPAITTTDCGNKEYWAKWVESKPEPEFTWTYDVSVNAGGIYPVRVSSTGDANVTIEIVETISGVSGSFTAGNPATGTVTLGNYPAAETFTYRATSPETGTWAAKTETKTVTITRCAKADILSYAVDPVNAGGSVKPKYYCETSGVGRIMPGKGASSISCSAATFTGESWATKYNGSSDHSIQAYQDNVFKIVLYVKSGSSKTTITTLKYSDSHISSDGDGTNILSSSQIIYNDNPAQTNITQNAYETVTIIPPAPMKKDGWVYFKLSSGLNVWGAKLYSAGGDEVTSVAFSGETEVEKYPGDAPFIKAAAQTTTPILSGGSITYKSSDESVATVDQTTGEVTVLAPGRTTITAKLSAFGCFNEATATYSVVVKKCIDPECTIAVTSGTARKCAGESVTMTATAVEGAAIKWFKDGVPILGETGASYTTTEAGEYYATATKTCLQVSNTIVVENLAAPTAVALHDYYYIKAGRERPDISLFQLTNVKIDPSSFTMSHPAPDGCSYELREDGIVYLVGTPSLTLAAADYDLTLTTVNDCGFTNASATMHLYSLETTAKPQIAWVAIGTHLDGTKEVPTKGEDLPGTPDADKSTSHALYTYLSGFFDMTAVNAYCTTDTRKISDYCSQFDLVLLTDYPDTNVKPDGESGGKEKSYSNAYGCLVDELPLLTFEAFVADCPNWGINSNPKTPDPKQIDMTLLCSAHNIFAGTTIDVNDKIGMLSSISGNGLQGFTGLDAPPGMLNIATIENNESNGGTLVVCCERQKVIEARMMIMGLNYNDMGNLTDDGKLVVKQIIEYLLQFKEMADCSIVFDDKNKTHVWSDPKNWYPAYNALPKPLQAVRVDKPCQVDIMNAHCSSIRLRKDGSGGFNGTLTILPNGGLTVLDYIKEVHGTNFMTTYPSAAGDLVIQAGENGQNGSLVFGSVEDDLQATVEYYSLAKDANVSGKKPVWQYMGIPISDGPMAIDAYYAAWMCSWESEGTVSSNWVWVENEDKIQPFKGYCITQAESKKYTHIGSLSKPEVKDLPLYYFESVDGDGFNMFANSWVAPIDITKMEAADFGGAAEPTIFIYNTGTREQYEGAGAPSTTGEYTGAGQFNAIPVAAAPYLGGSLTKIPTMQGFFVQATKEGTLTLDYQKLCFNTEDYTTTAEIMRAPKRIEDEEPAEERSVEKIVPEVMRIDVASTNWGDRLYILMHPEFSEAFDLGWDGSKQEGDAEAPMLALSHGNGLLAVAAIESADERYLTFRAGKETDYTFRFNYDGETIYLYDYLTGQATPILTGNTYSFRADNMTPINRFLITKNPPKVPTDILAVDQEMTAQPQKYIDHGQLFILYHGRVYDMTGKRVAPQTGKEETR